jgi:hypothetical protein
MPVFLPDILIDRPRTATLIMPGSNRIVSRYRKDVPVEFTDQCVLGRSKLKDSLVFGLTIWSVAPTFVGSSPLPGVGSVKGPRDRKASLSRTMLAFRMRRVPLTSWSTADAGGTLGASSASAKTAGARPHVI